MMKQGILTLFFLHLCFSACFAMRLEENKSELQVTIHPDFSSSISENWKQLKKNKISVTAIDLKSEMVELLFRESLTVKETKVNLILSIPGLLDDVRVVPKIQFSEKHKSWQFQINPKYLDKTVLTLHSVVSSKETGTYIMRRVYKLKK